MGQSSSPGAKQDYSHTAAHQAWQQALAGVLNKRRDPGDHMTGAQAEARLTTLIEGLTIAPLYPRPETGPALGCPGEMPFTRGSQAHRDAEQPWLVVARHAHADAAAINEDLHAGCSGIWLHAGADGIPAQELPGLLSGLDLTDKVVHFTGLDTVSPELVEACQRAASVNFGIDPVSRLNVTGASIDAAATVADFADVDSGVIWMCLNGSVFHDAGATAVDQIALTVACGIEVLRTLVASGASVEQAWHHMSFRYAVDADQFINIAMLRAARALWATVGAQLGIAEAQRGMVQYAVTSTRMLSQTDPWVNLLRDTVAAFAAGVGGAQAVTVLPFDSVVGVPDELGRRLARNTQALLLEESHVGAVIDPAGGSDYVEALTTQMAEMAWDAVQRIEADGGFYTYWSNGDVAKLLSERQSQRNHDLATRTRPLTGTSEFPLYPETPLERTPAREAGAGALHAQRDAAPFEALREQSAAIAEATGEAPRVQVIAVGTAKDHGPRLTFCQNLFAIAGLGIETAVWGDPDADPAPDFKAGPLTVIAAAPADNAKWASRVAKTLRDHGVQRVVLAGQAHEAGDEAVCDEAVNTRTDVVQFLRGVLNTMMHGESDTNTAEVK